jgi:hypothetical protein
VHALKDGAARGLTDREMVERTLGIDGNEVLGYHDARTRAIAQGLRKPDGTLADFAALSAAIDRASLAATADALAGQLLAADRAGVFALQTSHLLVSDRDALARQIAVEVLEPSDLSTGVADVRRAQAMRACVQSDAEVRLSLIANESFLARAKMIFHARRTAASRGVDPSNLYLVAGNPELAASGMDTLLAARVRTVALRGEDFLDVVGIVSSVGYAADVSQCRELCRLTRDVVQRGDVADMLAQSLRLQCGAREARAGGSDAGAVRRGRRLRRGPHDRRKRLRSRPDRQDAVAAGLEVVLRRGAVGHGT